jgi:hypothetical protein
MKTSLRVLALSLIAVAVQAAMVVAFAWPVAHIAPRDVPLVVAGPDPAATAVTRQLDMADHGAFKITRVADENAARDALTGRSAYGAIVASPSGPHVLIASAASPAVAQLLTQVAQRSAGRPAPAPEDVVPTAPKDPRGTTFAAMALPLVLSGVAGGALLGLFVPSARGRLVGLLIFAVGAGLASTAIVQTGLSALPGSYLAVAGVIGLMTLAGASTVAGLTALLGRAGTGLGGLIMVLVANPLSGVTSAPELLPQPWGAIGQALPAGAGATMLRSVAFFDGARLATPLTVLLCWTAAGVLLITAGTLRTRKTRRRSPAPEPSAPMPINS